jgi:hypothetical protein
MTIAQRLRATKLARGCLGLVAGIIQETDIMDAQSLPKVRMPNRDGFVPAKPVWPPSPKKPSWY